MQVAQLAEQLARTALDIQRTLKIGDDTQYSAQILSQLGSIYLGGVRAEQLAAAGAIEEHTAGAIGRIDALFASYPSPQP